MLSQESWHVLQILYFSKIISEIFLSLRNYLQCLRILLFSHTITPSLLSVPWCKNTGKTTNSNKAILSSSGGSIILHWPRKILYHINVWYWHLNFPLFRYIHVFDCDAENNLHSKVSASISRQSTLTYINIQKLHLSVAYTAPENTIHRTNNRTL